MKKFQKIAGISLIITLCFSLSCSVMAYEASTVMAPAVEGAIDPEIYAMVDAHENGTFVERNESSTTTPEEVFSKFRMADSNSNPEFDVEYLYDIKQIGAEKYEATRIALYSTLEQESQGEERGVVLFTRISYTEKDFGKPWGYVMLNKVKGGVVKNNGDVWCEFLYMKYSVSGDAYYSDGSRLGFTGTSTNYGSAVLSPQVGTTYSINGPNDYYYNMGATGSRIVGWVKGSISYRLSSAITYLEVPSAITAI